MTSGTIRIILFSTMNVKTPLSTLSLAILGLMAQKPRSGYDLRKVFSTTPMGHFSTSPGAIYPALKRIEKSRWIRGKIDNRQSLRPKLVYALTKKGRNLLERHLSQPVTRDDVIWHMDDLMLRFAFMGEIVGREKTVQFLREFLLEVESYLSSLREYFDEVRESMSPYGRLAIENGIDSYKSTANWVKRAIKELQKE